MAIPGLQKALVDWNVDNPELKLSPESIKKQTELLGKVKACYEDSGIPLPKEPLGKVVLKYLRKICDPQNKGKNKATNDVHNAVKSDLRKRSADPNPEKPLTKSEQVKIKKMRADEADISEMRRKMDKLKAFEYKNIAARKATQDAIKTLEGRMTWRNEDTAHGNTYELPIDEQGIIADELTLSALTMDFGGERNAKMLMHLFYSIFHFPTPHLRECRWSRTRRYSRRLLCQEHGWKKKPFKVVPFSQVVSLI